MEFDRLMKFKVITVGRIKETFFVESVNQLSKLIRKNHIIDFVEVADEKCPEKLSDKEMLQVKDKEADRILQSLNDDAYVIALAINGKMLTSDGLQRLCGQHRDKEIVFIIGGSLGLADSILRRSNYKLSFSKLTFPHQLMKVLLVEQIAQIQ